MMIPHILYVHEYLSNTGLCADHLLLKMVELAGNNLGEVGGTALAEGLLSNTSITHLDLRSNNLSNGGAVALAAMLEGPFGNKAIKTLLLGGNGIGNKGGAALAKAIHSSKAGALVVVLLDRPAHHQAIPFTLTLARTLTPAHMHNPTLR
jgi:Ran GTPase-activating protein (RanGAP) involved in mRNA processing and transport